MYDDLQHSNYLLINRMYTKKLGFIMVVAPNVPINSLAIVQNIAAIRRQAYLAPKYH